MSDIFGAASAQLKSELQRGAEVTPPNANDLEAAARRMRQENDAARLRQTAIETQGSNPDTAARAQRLGRDMGLPPAVVERNLPEVERQAELVRLNGLSYDDYLANYLADPDNYRVARDDVSTLEEMSKAARFIGDVLRSPPSGVAQGVGMALSGAGALVDASARSIDRGVRGVFGDRIADLFWFEEGPNPAEFLRSGGRRVEEIGRDIGVPAERQNVVTDVFTGLGQLTAQMTAMVLSRGKLGMPMLLSQGAAQQADKQEQVGAYGTGAGDAAIFAGAAVTATLEKFGLDFIMRKLPEAARQGIMSKLQSVAVSIGVEAVQEIVEGILQNVVEYAFYNPNAEIFQDFSREAIAAGGAAGIMRGILLAASGGRASARQRQGSERAQQDSEALKRVNELAEQSKLRERNPDKFREFVRGLVEPERAVEIDAETAVELFQSEPDLTQFMTRDEAERVSREVALAREVGSDVRMPLSTFIGAFVGHPQFDTLAENVRLSDNAPTAREASMTPEDLEKQVGLLREEVGTVARQQEVTRQIYDDIFAQLKAAAVDDLSATKYAAIFTARLRTRAERLGQDPLELYRQSRPEIRRKYDGPRLRLARLGTPAEPEYVSPVMPAGLKRVLEDARKGIKLRQRSMSSFFARMGGIKDQGGELMAIMGTYRAMPGLVNNKSGRTLDRALETAVEEGYMPYGSTIAEFLDVLSDDVNKRAQNFGWSEDFEGKARQEAVDDLVNELDALGLTIRDSDEAIAQALGIEPEMASATLEDLEAMDRMRFRGAEPAPLGPAEDPNARTLDQGQLIGEGEIKRVLRREPGQFDAVEQAAFDEFMNTRPDKDRILANLKQHKGTPWALQAVEGIFVRQAMRMVLRGETPGFQSSLDSNNVKKTREVLATRGIEGMWRLIEADGGLLGAAAKPVNNVNSSFINCDPSADCAKYCYATTGNYRYANVIVKSELVTMAVELDPVRAAQRVSQEYKATAEFIAGKALRLFDKGDGNEAWLPFIEELNRQGIRTQIFSKAPEFLRKVPTMNLRLLSIDESNMDLADQNLDLPVAFVYTGKHQIEMLAKMAARKQVQVVLPVKLGQRLLDGSEISDLEKSVPEVKPYLCPIDAGFKKLGKTSQSGTWNCTKCDVNGGVGCFHGNATKTVMASLETKPDTVETQRRRAERILELRRRINEVLTGPAGDVADPGRVPSGGVEGLLRQVDVLMDDLLRDFADKGEGRPSIGARPGAVAPGGSAEGSVSGRTDGTDGGRTLNQSARPLDPRETLRQYQGGTSVTQDGFLDLSDQADDLLDAVRAAQSIKAAERVADDWVVARGKKTGLEHLVAFDRDGGLIAVGRGDERFIAFPKTMIDAGKAGRIAYATHNHPRNSGFSVPDLGGSLEYGMDITAMGHGGAIVSGRAGPALAGKDLPVGLAGNIMAEIEKPVRDYFQEKVNAGQISVDRALFAHSHVVDIFRHRYGLIDLRSNGLQFINGAGFDINTIIRTIDEKVANVLQRNKLDIPAVRDFTGDQAPGGSFRAEQGGAGAVGVSQGGGGAARRSGRIVPGSDPRQLALLESDTLEVDGVLRPTANSEGRPIHPTEEGVRNFWRWFGDSKVVDDQGRPLVVYRGGPAQDWKTGEQITEFQSSNGPWAGFFSSSKEVASRFASVLSGSVVTPTFVSISNPLEVDANGAPARDFQIDASAIEKADSPIRQQFLDGDYDGLILRNTADEGDVFVPRESEQVKSAIGNTGAFSRDDGRILNQEDPRNLVVLHNLKPEAVLHANKMGGLPIPSVAVANKDQGFGGFGSISLVGSPSLVDPKQDKAAKVFDADVYSPRYPTVTYEIDFNALRAVEGDLKALAEKLGRDFYDGDLEEKGGRAIREGVVWKAKFLEERGALPDPVLRTDGKVDRWKTEEAIEAAVKPLDAEFSDWADAQEKKLIKKEKIFDGFTPMGYRRYLPHNLDVVVRLLKKGLRGGESFNYGVGSIRAHHAKQFKSLKEIQAKRGNLVSTEAMRAVKQELNDDFKKLADSLQKNYKFKVGFGYYDDFSAALGEMVKRGRAPLNEAFNDLSQEQLSDINAFITKLRNAPSEYFEAKIQRVVKLNEFVGAIVPRYGVSDKVIAALEANGLKIVRYDFSDDRTAALQEFQGQFFQRRETGPRGSIQFLPDGQTIISLTEKADLSTFLHEMSHAWLEEMKADARLPDAPAQIVEDWNRIAAYLGIDPNVDFIPTEAHETFARTGEAYFMEGKAPSLELASAFERFKAWMVRIYRTIAGLNVPINDEIRGVFDRMLAADDEIEAAKNQFKFEGLFALAKDAGMTEDEFRRYQDLAAKARLEAEQKVLAMLQAEERRAQREEYREARETITAEVEAQVKGEPVYQTIAMLARGEMPDGTTLDTPMKLDRAMVRASYGTGIGKRLPRGVMADNGVPPDLVAPMFGFTSGDEMIKAMEAAPPLQQEIRRRVQERLKAQFPNPVDDGRAAEEAIEALHNDAQMQVLEAEFKALQRLGAGKLVDAAVRRSGGQGRQAGQAMGPEARAEAALGAQRRAAEGKAARERVKVTVDSLRADRKAIERAADAVINDTTVNDLLNTQKWRRAERASANAVIDAVAGQDWPAAAWHQRQRIINAHMVRRSMEARKDIEKAIGRFDKYLSKKPGPIDPDYLEKVRTILSAYQFGPQLSDRRRNLLELRAILDWQKALSEDEQARLDIPPEITAADDKTHYRDMTVGEFMALRDTVENLATVGRTKNRLLREQAERDLNRTAKMVAETILDNVKIVARRSREAVEKGAGYGIAKFKDQFFASHRKIESLVREFDGFQKLGPVWQALFKPLQDAQNTETRMSIEATEAIRKLFEGYPADARRTWRTKTTYYPEIGQSLSKATIMSIALNWGNEGNREAIRKGYKWSDDQVQAVLNQTLTESDWKFVQGAWDFIGSYFPQLAALEKRVKGIEPVKVEASPVRTPFGEFPGGYYPLKYDPDLSERAFSFQVDKMAQNLMTGQVAKASTRTGAALERVGSGGMPVRLELDVMFEHVAEVIHDLSHREAILDVMRLLEHPEVKGAVLETKGPQFHRAMKDWVRDIAAGDVPALTWFDKVVQHLRGGMSIAAMGWKLTTALVQVTGFIQSAVMLPKGALLKSVAGFYGNPLAMSRKADFVFERSVEMRTRSKNLDRDIRDALRKLGPEGKTDAVKRSFFYLTGLMDMGVALPTWLAAYETGMDQFQGDEAKAIDYADQVVRTTQSSGLQKDLASIQRGDPRMKMFTAFYSYFSATYNLMVEQGRGMKGARDMPRFVANMALLTIVPAVLSELLLGRGPDEDEEEPWWAWAGKVGLKFALSGFVGVRDVVNAMGSDFGYAGSPVGSAVESMVKLGKQIGQGEMDKGLARAAVDTAGPVLHLPSRQAWITAEGIYLWSEGHEITPFEMFVTRDPKKFR